MLHLKYQKQKDNYMKKLITLLAMMALFAITGCTKVDQTERGIVLHGGSVVGTVEPAINRVLTSTTDYPKR